MTSGVDDICDAFNETTVVLRAGMKQKSRGNWLSCRQTPRCRAQCELFVNGPGVIWNKRIR
jgi:hypothetical protein